MIIRLHGEEVSHTSRGTPSFEEDFVDDSSESLRQEFLDLLDKAAHTATRSTHADEALSASVAAAGMLSAAQSKPQEIQIPEKRARDIAGAQDETRLKSEADVTVTDGFSVQKSKLEGTQKSCATKAQDTEQADTPSVPDESAATIRTDANNDSATNESNSGETITAAETEAVVEDSNGLEVPIETDAPATEELALHSEIPIESEVSGQLSMVQSDGPQDVPAESNITTVTAALQAKNAETGSDSAAEIPQNQAIISDVQVATAATATPSQQESTSSSVAASQSNQVTVKDGSNLAQLLATLKQELLSAASSRTDEMNKDGIRGAGLSAVPLLQRPDAAVKIALLKQSFEHLKGAVTDIKSAHSSSLPAPGAAVSQSNFGSSVSSFAASHGAAQKAANSVAKEASRPLPKGFTTRTLERVESALKEAAKSRDGKTLSFRLDPPQLGHVKVDVSLKEGALHARMVPESAQVATLLREKASELQSTLRRLGLNVETVTVSVGSETSSQTFTGGEGSREGNTFHQERNGMPGKEGQVIETTFGNELASVGQATKEVTDDHWVA